MGNQMKTTFKLITVCLFVLLSTGCKEQASKSEAKTFMFWCFRDEIVSADYHIPDMTTPAIATLLQNRLKTVPGYEHSECNLQNRMLTVSYQSSMVRSMNFEEAIALSGFSVNGRPANKAEGAN
jgi:hypothetical protein